VKENAPVIGPYELLETLGRGGMGVVYRARHVETGEAVALKTVRVPSAALLQGLRREIHALARLRHPGIVRIVDEGVDEGVPWYAMELLEGVTLRRHADSGGSDGAQQTATLHSQSEAAWWTGELSGAARASGPRLRQRAALTLVRRLCAPLAYLHGEGLVHRDLKPDNILIRAASSERRAASGERAAGRQSTARSSQLAARSFACAGGLRAGRPIRRRAGT
jgi:eukaryotic-like serine/threonine-protein kinase